MVRFATIFLALFSALALCGASVEAETTTLIVSDHGVLGAMHRLGCNNPQWLGRTMIESGILESQLKRLPEGKTIIVPDGCEKTAPSSDDVTLTRQIFATQHTLQSSEEASATNLTLTAQIAAVDTKIAVEAKTIADLKNQLTVSQAAAAQWKQQSQSSIGWMTVVVFSVISTAGSFLISWFLLRIPQRRSDSTLEGLPSVKQEKIIEGQILLPATTSSPQALSIEFCGRRIEFRDTSEYRRGCPLCPEKWIKPIERNMRQHLETKHPELRVVEITPEAMEELLLAEAHP